MPTSTAALRHRRPGQVSCVNRPEELGEPSFAAIYRELYEPMLWLAVSKLDSELTAEDVVQFAFHQLWQRWDTVIRPAAYLRRSVVNRCNDELRRVRSARRSRHLIAEQVHDEVDYLADALGQLSHKRRRAVFLRFYCGRTVPEISQLTGEPIGTVKSLLHRSLIELRAALA